MCGVDLVQSCASVNQIQRLQSVTSRHYLADTVLVLRDFQKETPTFSPYARR